MMLIGFRREHLFISARNDHVKNHLLRRYGRVRTIHSFCVSNKLYGECRRPRNRSGPRRSSNNQDKAQAIEQKLESSGIPELREFCLGIPIKAHIEETQHFLDTRLKSLVEKTELWLTANMAEISVNPESTQEILTMCQDELKTVSFTTFE